MTGGNVVNTAWTFPAGGYVTSGNLTANGLNALNGAGIVAEYALLNGATLSGSTAVNGGYTGSLTWQPTFNPYTGDTPTATTLSTSTAVVYVLPSGVQVAALGNPSIINPKSKTQFILFGVGKRCAMVGTVMSNAPSNFPNDAVHENPNVVYQRFGVVFQVEDANGNGLPAAVFLGAVAIESNILLGTDSTMSSYYQNIPAISSPASGPGQ